MPVSMLVPARMSAPMHASTLSVIAACLLLVACGAPAPQATLLSGTTMGSVWTVKVAGPLPMEPDALRNGVQAQFDTVDAALSTWRADSALSRFNAAAHADWQTLDAELFEVLDYALQLARISDGAYDITVGPLVDLWGFGPDPARSTAPSAEAIARARAQVGWHRIELDRQGRRARRAAGVRIDLSSLGKGRGVDRVAAWLESQGVHHYLIDLSGKLRAAGGNERGEPWRVAVEKPEADDPSGRPNITDAVIALQDEAVATAGDYRRYFESGGAHYSHLIDPASGMPVDHGTVSATALAADCMSADAWATLLVLMPHQAAQDLAARHGIPALLIVRDGQDVRLLPGAHWPVSQERHVVRR